MTLLSLAIEGGSHMDSIVQVPTNVLGYLQEQQTLTLATTSPDGGPRANTFLFVTDGEKLYFWTRPNSASARNVVERPRVAFAIDEYSADLRETRGLHGLGDCTVVTGIDIARVADLFGQKFPQLSRGMTMTITFFSITPTELVFIDNGDTGMSTFDNEFGAQFHGTRV
jgi:uncharacterized protein YhbP (UPF0306 family)